MESYRVEVKIKNNLLLENMKVFGIKNAADLANKAGVAKCDVYDYLALKKAPIDRRGDVKESALLISAFFGVGIDELFPAEFMQRALKTNFSSREFGIGAVDSLIYSRLLPDLEDSVSLEEHAIYDDFKKIMGGIVGSLGMEREFLLRSLYGVEQEELSMAEAARRLGVSYDDAVAMRNKSLKLLRHPTRSCVIREFLD